MRGSPPIKSGHQRAWGSLCTQGRRPFLNSNLRTIFAAKDATAFGSAYQLAISQRVIEFLKQLEDGKLDAMSIELAMAAMTPEELEQISRIMLERYQREEDEPNRLRFTGSPRLLQSLLPCTLSSSLHPLAHSPIQKSLDMG